MVVVDKPARLASVPGGSETTSAREILERTRGELFVVHRLDMGTSGVLAFAKTKEALRPLNLAFADRTAQKTYIARLEGLLEGEERQQGSIALPIALHWFERPKQCVLPVSEGGREALTDYEVIGVEDTPKASRASWPCTRARAEPISCVCTAHTPKDSAFPSTATPSTAPAASLRKPASTGSACTPHHSGSRTR
ncbi:MAG: pseudouridine synthase [Sutterella wadsworthensis]